MSAKESLENRLKTQLRRIDDLTSQLEDLRLEHSTLKQRFDRLRDDHSDQLASIRGRVTASERWGRKKEVEELQPASIEEIYKTLSEPDRRMLRALLGSGAAAQPSSPSTQGG